MNPKTNSGQSPKKQEKKKKSRRDEEPSGAERSGGVRGVVCTCGFTEADPSPRERVSELVSEEKPVPV